jgi:hypothetical protein
MLSVAIKAIMLSIVILSVIVLRENILSLFLSDVMLSVFCAECHN